MNTAAISTTSALERYLKRATFGLNAERRQAVWDELEEHVLTRQDGYCLIGHDPETALQLAINELGPALRLSAGMNRVHNMPKIMSIAAVSVLSAVLLVQAGGNTEPLKMLGITFQRPITPSCARGTALTPNKAIKIVSQRGGVTCYTFQMARAYSGSYLNLRDLAAAINNQGGQARFRTARTLEIQVQGNKLQTLSTRFSVGSEHYADTTSLVQALAQIEPVILSGYQTPEIRSGKLRFQFGQAAQQGVGQYFYQGLITPLFQRLTADAEGQPGYAGLSYNNSGLPKRRIQTGLKPGEVVMLLSREATGGYTADIAPVAADGTATLRIAQNAIRFVSDVKQLSPYASQGRINAVLVRVTNVPLNQLKTGVFLPTQLNSDAP